MGEEVEFREVFARYIMVEHGYLDGYLSIDDGIRTSTSYNYYITLLN